MRDRIAQQPMRPLIRWQDGLLILLLLVAVTPRLLTCGTSLVCGAVSLACIGLCGPARELLTIHGLKPNCFVPCLNSVTVVLLAWTASLMKSSAFQMLSGAKPC